MVPSEGRPTMSDSVRQLHRGIVRARQGSTGRGCRYPAELRIAVARQVRAWRSQGESWAAISRELGLPSLTLQRWLESENPAGFRPVVVGSEDGRDPDAKPVVVLPNGIRIEGLGMPDLVAFVRALS